MNLRIPDDVVSRDVGGEEVILHLGTGTYFGLDRVGTRIWRLIGELGSLDRVLATLLDEYEVGEVELRRDLDDLIAKLRANGLIANG